MIRYQIHHLIAVRVDVACTAALRDTIAFQLNHFRDDEASTTAEVTINVRPYAQWNERRTGAAQAFHLYQGADAAWLDDPEKRVAHVRRSFGWDVYADSPAFLVNLLIQFTLVERGVTLVHAAAVADPVGNVTLLPGPGGVGKTALLGSMVRDHGYKLLGDDIVGLTRDGDCLAFPRSFVLKDYHQSVYPELFKEIDEPQTKTNWTRKTANLFVDNMPLKGLARAILRRTGHLKQVQNSLTEARTPGYLATPSVEEVFGKGCVLPRGPVRDVVFLERWDQNHFNVESMSQTDMTARLFSIIHHEWVGHMRHFWSLGAMGLVDLASYFTDVNDIAGEAVTDLPCRRMRIPHDASPQALTETFLTSHRPQRKEAA